MRKIFVFVGILACALTFARIVPVMQSNSKNPVSQSYNDPVLSEAANLLLSNAEAAARKLNSDVKWWKSIVFWAGISALGFTGLATFLAGWRRKNDPDDDTEFLNKKITIIGLLTAVATLANSTHEFANSTVEPIEKDAATISKAIKNASGELKAEPGEEAGILSELKLLVDRFSE